MVDRQKTPELDVKAEDGWVWEYAEMWAELQAGKITAMIGDDGKGILLGLKSGYYLLEPDEDHPGLYAFLPQGYKRPKRTAVAKLVAQVEKK